MKRDYAISITLLIVLMVPCVSGAVATDLDSLYRGMVEGDPGAVIASLEEKLGWDESWDRSEKLADSSGKLILLARAYLESGRKEDCAETADEILAADPKGSARLGALTLLVMSDNGDGRKDAALSLVEAAEEDDLVADYLAYVAAKSLLRSDALDDAAAGFHHAYSISGDRVVKLMAMEALGDALEDLHDYPASERSYLTALALASTEADKARVLFKRARVLKRLNRKREALDVAASVVNNYPSAPDAERALDLLRELDKTHTSRYRQGMVLYHTGEYRRAVDFFDYYLKYEKSGGTVSFARYFLARSLQRSGQYWRAVGAYRKFLGSHPGHEYRHFAWLREGYCLEKAGKIEEATQTYLSYPESFPAGEWADRCLWYAAELLRREGELEEASSIYARVAAEYPASEFALRAAIKSAICLSDAGKSDEALGVLSKMADSPDGAISSAAGYWFARLAGDHPDSPDYLLGSWRSDPWGFYGRRAYAILNSRDSGGLPGTEDGSASRHYVLLDTLWAAESDRWFSEIGAPGNPSGGARRLLEENSHFARGWRLLELGLYDYAEGEFERARYGLKGDPELLYMFSDYMSRIGFHRLSILAAINLSGHVPGGRAEAPLAIRRLLNPAGYRSIVEAAAEANSVRPELLFALIRQESFFDRKAVSRAGARGLSQIMPSTGRDLAREVREGNYSTSKLFNAETNLKLGAHYLRKLRDDYGDELIALAAYNAGEVNADEWIRRANCTEPDFVVEEIGFDETYEYVKTVYVVSDIYKHIWNLGGETGAAQGQRE